MTSRDRCLQCMRPDAGKQLHSCRRLYVDTAGYHQRTSEHLHRDVRSRWQDVILSIMLGPCCRLHTADLSWVSSKVPTSWHIAEIRLSVKSGKPPNTASSFRPIIFLSCIGKLVKRLIHERLAHFLESHHPSTRLNLGSDTVNLPKSKWRQLPSLSTMAFNREGHPCALHSCSQTSPEPLTACAERLNPGQNGQGRCYIRWVCGFLRAFHSSVDMSYQSQAYLL